MELPKGSIGSLGIISLDVDRLKVLVSSRNEKVTIIREILGNTVEVVVTDGTLKAMLELGRDTDILAANRVSREFIEAAPRLRMIQTFTAGVENIDHDAIKERGNIILCNSHINAAEVAEYAITLLFAAAKNIIPNDRELRKGNWIYAFGGPRPNVEIRHKTCFILGLGNIGGEIAKRLRAFDVKLYAATRSGISQQSDLVDKLVKIDEARPLVETSDFIILSLPLTPESRGLVDRAFISWMKPTSILVNISRGPVIDEKALFDALKENRIRGAGLDVWWRYPSKWGGLGTPPSDMPFQDLDNVVISPHRAGYSENTESEYFQFAGENILRFIHGENPVNVVDL
ncbi:MAG: 2-hydroxyacid dehydrogenase, partial [Candidatus Thorarchaeota archaeon]|nr:2-hydroxyacid dehydrogenase [Candidatus Thorarchaeota archaeon]